MNIFDPNESVNEEKNTCMYALDKKKCICQYGTMYMYKNKL